MKNCLVVDDSRVIRKVARRILEDLSFQVEEAGDGAEALSRCRSNMPDAILLDWNMPVMNGHCRGHRVWCERIYHEAI
jgi:two-component system, chemotaxis family, chemotaxis protein CheY